MEHNEPFPFRAGDTSDYAELFEKFEPLIKSEVSECVRKLPAGCEYDRDELTSEAMLALYNAAQSYEDGKNVTFGLYAKICIHNRMISCARKITSRFRKRMREEQRRFERANAESPEEKVVSDYQSERVRELIAKECSPLERRIFLMYLEKKSYAEISESVGRNVRSVGNAIYRVKKKLRDRFSSKGE